MIYLIGAGGHGKVVLEGLWASGVTVQLLDGDAGLEGKRILGCVVDREERALAALLVPVRFVVGIGDGGSRQRVVERWEERGHRLARVVHPSAIISPSAMIEEGAVILSGAVVQTEARIGKGAIVNSAASVDHDCRVGAFAHVAPGARLAGGVELGELAWVGIGACVRETVVIGARTVIGAGSVVVDDLPKDVVAYGNPCRVVRQIGRGEEKR